MTKQEMLHQIISRELLKIAEALQPEYKLTLVARHPSNPNAHIVIGDDKDTPAVVYLLEHPELTPIQTK